MLVKLGNLQINFTHSHKVPCVWHVILPEVTRGVWKSWTPIWNICYKFLSLQTR